MVSFGAGLTAIMSVNSENVWSCSLYGTGENVKKERSLERSTHM